ncbi:MAG: NAD(P)H-dependent oxidoreductase subunit E, partial [Dehalococcoidia bacterium]|nr:NAD(P)H-dependent oxidoreductase subunit E [Dehalococcoidia bacterium]
MSEKKDTTAGGQSGAGLLPRLKAEVEKNDYLSRETLEEIEGQTGLPLNSVYGVASFYAYLPVTKVGRNVIKVCNCLPCEMKQASEVVEVIRREIGIGPGQTTPDGKFTLEIAGCIGACDQAPAMLINDKLY